MNTSESLTVALLMGGRSRRMGSDKAYLEFPGTGQPTWRRQTDLLQSLTPQARFISLRPSQPSPPLPLAWRIIVDETPEAGPIGGISACLASLETEFLLVVAVDLLVLTAKPLERLLARCQPGCGAVYRRGDFYEPLAAVYPKSAAGSASLFLRQGGRRVQSWVATLVDSGSMHALNLPSAEAALFANVNDPSAYAALTHPSST